MTPFQMKKRPGKMIVPPTICKLCKKDFLNARALVQHTQLIHLYKYDRNG